MSYERAGREFVFRAKLVFGLAVIGAAAGGATGVWMLAREAGFDAFSVSLLPLAGWVVEVVRRGFGGELLLYAGAGAALLAGPALYFMFRPRASGPNF